LDSRQEQEIFPLFDSVQTGSGAHTASYTMGTWDSFLEGKGEGGVELTTYLHLARKLSMAELYIYSPIRLQGVLLYLFPPEELRGVVLEKSVLARISGPIREDLTG
jgi:hypothetical protein